MADLGIGFAMLLEQDVPLVIGRYADLSAKQDLLDRAMTLASPTWGFSVINRADALLGVLQRNDLVVFDPDDEVAAVAYLDQYRERLLHAAARVLLLLRDDGDGVRALARAPALASFARGLTFSCGAEVSQDDAAREFQQKHGTNHDAWLERWDSGELADTLDNNLILADALAIRGSR